MADKPIYQVKDPTAYQWGKRYYYWHCHGDSTDFAWFNDNLESSTEGLRNEQNITAFRIFNELWDPERTMSPVLPFASIPTPHNNAINVAFAATDSLRWIGARNAISYNVYFGASENPQLIRNQAESFFIPDSLSPNTSYYWRIDAVTETGTIPGKIWKFATGNPASSKI